MPKDSEEHEINDAPSTELLSVTSSAGAYTVVLSQVVELMEADHRAAARSVNSIMTATYWEIGRRIVELEQKGESRAEYGKQIIEQLALDLSERFGRGLSLEQLIPDACLLPDLPTYWTTVFA